MRSRAVWARAMSPQYEMSDRGEFDPPAGRVWCCWERGEWQLPFRSGRLRSRARHAARDPRRIGSASLSRIAQAVFAPRSLLGASLVDDSRVTLAAERMDLRRARQGPLPGAGRMNACNLIRQRAGSTLRGLLGKKSCPPARGGTSRVWLFFRALPRALLVRASQRF